MTVERFLGFVEAKGVNFGDELEESLMKYQTELERKVKTKVSDNETNIGPSVLEVCKKFLGIVPIKEIDIENIEGTSYQNVRIGSEDGIKEVFAFALNGWAATYHTEYQRLTLIRAN